MIVECFMRLALVECLIFDGQVHYNERWCPRYSARQIIHPLPCEYSFKMGHLRPLFLLFLYCQQSTLKLLIKIFCQLLDSNCGLLISEATAPPTEPHPCPTLLIFFTSTNLSYQCDQMME